MYAFSVNAENIGTFKINYILNNVEDYQIFREKLEVVKNEFFENLKKEENKLIFEKNEIEDSKIILNKSEFSKRVSEFEIKNNNFQLKVDSYNNYLNYNKQINEKIIFDAILEIMQHIASDKKLDLILSENQYFLSSNNIDISDLAIKKLNDISLEFIITTFNENE